MSKFAIVLIIWIWELPAWIGGEKYMLELEFSEYKIGRLQVMVSHTNHWNCLFVGNKIGLAFLRRFL